MTPKTIKAESITSAVAELCATINYGLGADVLAALRSALHSEKNARAHKILEQILQNASIAQKGEYPLCQDTGLCIVFAEIGNRVIIDGALLSDAIQNGIRRGYHEAFCRKSIVADPFRRNNTGDNTPAVIYTNIVEGDGLLIRLAAKGGGSENMSRSVLLKPADGRKGAEEFIIETVKMAGGNACPPLIVGIGIGGSLDACCVASKKALFREVGSTHPDAYYAQMEEELRKRINELGIGPMGLGGNTTALAVHIEALPCHIASLPVSVALNCHSHRHGEVRVGKKL